MLDAPPLADAPADGGTARHRAGVVPFPDEDVARYRAAGLWGTATLAQEFRAVADAHPDRPALITATGTLTFAALDEATDRIAHGLGQLGLRPGDPVVFQVTNRAETVLAWYAVLKAGAVPVCSLAFHRGHEISQITRQVGAVAHLVEAGTGSFDLVAFGREQAAGHPTLRLLLTIGAPSPGDGAVAVETLGAGVDPATARAWVEQVQAGIDPDDVAVFQLSGGTTGVPKVIPRLHAEYWYNAQAYAAEWGWDTSSRVAHLIPIIHNAGVVCGLHAPHSVGACLVLTTADLDQALPLMAAAGATDVLFGHGHFGAVDHPAFPDASAALRTVVLSGTKVPTALFETFERAGLWTGQLFGMGEGMFLTTSPGTSRRVRNHTVGTPLSPLDEVRILQPTSEEQVPAGEVGELATRGPYTIRGYFSAPEHNSRAFTGDGFYRTGDLASVTDVDGVQAVSIEGRIKDVINRGGEKVNAEEVELLLLQHPAVAAAAVVAMPDPRLGERACAYLVATGDPVDLEDVRRHLDGLGVAKFKWPERLEWVTELPKTLVGKLDKKRLREDITARLRAE
ncbi:(2,3-dihydroxybenzoyl)adenylate synthase [Klenkia brasiliensis]|uniref:Non-ribosomal peptide synthetase component E (Peptide arylation enzyme) n=1 Tax=Klenkia brasiliensis TaxID=333142 RepID=A0A1G7Q6K1_9ACTN|nr:AMP-binding protein [Klenkia brasiliensis]SDF94182.1 Non-ribosomal peptide synthetase component E (peptide arylation enzyme) [Klenkia brasiliensis]